MARASTATKHNRMNSVSSKEIADALQRAKELTEVAYGVHAVKQPDGTVLELCFNARLDRAYRMYGDADGEMKAKLGQATSVLSQQIKDVYNDAAKAASDYAALAISSGVTPEEIEIPVCDCDGCKEGALLKAFFDTETDMRCEVLRLLTPYDVDDPLPYLVKLLDNDDKAVRATLTKIADAQRAYLAACEAANGEGPDWRIAYALG